MNEKNVVSNELEIETETEVLITEIVETFDTENVTEQNIEVPISYAMQENQYSRYSFYLLAFLLIFLILTRLER